MKFSSLKPKLLAVLGISLFALSCSVKGELQDAVEELEELTNDAQTESSVD